MSKLSGKIAIVAGGAGALGKVVVERLLAEDVVVITTVSKTSKDIPNILGKQQYSQFIESIVADVTSETSVQEFYSKIFEKYPRIDILCNLVGGVSPKKYIEEIFLDDWNAMMDLNLTSCFLMMRGSVPLMKQNGFGRIINIASMPGVTPEAKRGAYGIAKAGVIALTKTAAAELKEFENITANAIAPSIILTEENKKWGTAEDFKKWVTPEQIADMILHLCSDNGKSINGQIINMYGRV